MLLIATASARCGKVPARGTATALLLALVIGILGPTGCSTSTHQPTTPGEVAVAFNTALLSRHITAAEALATPAYLPQLRRDAPRLMKSAYTLKHLRAGSTTITGRDAVVVLEGTICLKPGSDPVTPKNCETNTDPHTPTRPAFIVYLKRDASGHWKESPDTSATRL